MRSFEEVSFCTCFAHIRIPILNENAQLGTHDKVEHMCIVLLIEMNYCNYKILKKNKITRISINDDYNRLKGICYFAIGETPEATKDTR